MLQIIYIVPALFKISGSGDTKMTHLQWKEQTRGTTFLSKNVCEDFNNDKL